MTSILHGQLKHDTCRHAGAAVSRSPSRPSSICADYPPTKISQLDSITRHPAHPTTPLHHMILCNHHCPPTTHPPDISTHKKQLNNPHSCHRGSTGTRNGLDRIPRCARFRHRVDHSYIVKSPLWAVRVEAAHSPTHPHSQRRPALQAPRASPDLIQGDGEIDIVAGLRTRQMSTTITTTAAVA